MAEDDKTLRFKQSKGNSSSITNDKLVKLHVHNTTMVIYIQHKFHDIPFIGSLVMIEDRKIHLSLCDQRAIL